jgi:hypothetical protein
MHIRSVDKNPDGHVIQARGSLHAHIVLWVHPDDEQRVANEISASVPGIWNPATMELDPPNEDTHPMEHRLHMLVRALVTPKPSLSRHVPSST